MNLRYFISVQIIVLKAKHSQTNFLDNCVKKYIFALYLYSYKTKFIFKRVYLLFQ